MSSTKSIIISCAGIGSRLGLGQTKALIEIEGKSLIRRQLEMLKDVEDIRVVIGYQANDLVKEVLSIREDVTFVYNHNYFNSKTGLSYYLGAKDGNQYAIEWDGDLLVHPDDIQKILSEEGEFICYSEIISDEAVFVKVNRNNEVIEFSRSEGDYEWTGPACLKKTNLSYTTDDVFSQITPLLPIKGLQIRAYDIDTYDDYLRVKEIIKNW